jgi:hypothetical protein
MENMIGQQGEVRIYKIDKIPDGIETRPVERNKNGQAIISHSERGHHHVLTGGEVMERTTDVPAGMQIFYALLKKPESLKQDGPDPHETHDLESGTYMFTTDREWNPFAEQEQARRVAD